MIPYPLLLKLSEYANTISWVVASVLWFVLIVHLIYTVGMVKRGSMSMATYSVDPKAVIKTMRSIAIPLLIDMTGVVLTRTVVAFWRSGLAGRPGPMSPTQVSLMLLAAILMVIGTAWLTHAISRPTLGNWPWMLSVTAVLVTTAGFLMP